MKVCKGGFTFKRVSNSSEDNSPLEEDKKLASPNKEKMFINSEISQNGNEKILSNFDKSSNGDAEQNTRELLMEKNEMAALCRGCYIY
jgi:hypothetical protein